MKKRKVVVIGLSSISLIAVISLGASVAWFANGGRLNVRGMQINLTTDINLGVNTEPSESFEEYYSGDTPLPSEKLKEVEGYSPVSGMYSSLWSGNENEGTVPLLRDSYFNCDYKIPSTYQESKVATKGYFQQELYFYSNYTSRISINADKFSILPDVEKNKQAVSAVKKVATVDGMSDEEILEELNKLPTSLRVSIYDPNPIKEENRYTVISLEGKENTEFAGRVSTSIDNYYSYYEMENGEKYEFVFGEYNNSDKIIYDEAPLGDIIPEGRLNSFNAKTKAGVHPFNYEKSIENGWEPAKENVKTPEYVEENVEYQLIQETPKKLIISVYVEGWDKSCTNLTMYSSFNLSLSFKTVR